MPSEQEVYGAMQALSARHAQPWLQPAGGVTQ